MLFSRVLKFTQVTLYITYILPMLVSYGPIRDSSVNVVTEVHAGLLEAADFSLPQSILTGCVASPSSATVRNV